MFSYVHTYMYVPNRQTIFNCMLRMLSTRHGNVLNDTIIGLSEFCPTIKRVFSYMNLVKIGFNNMPKTKYFQRMKILYWKT